MGGSRTDEDGQAYEATAGDAVYGILEQTRLWALPGPEVLRRTIDAYCEHVG